jgi:hypothetical protein
MFDSFKELSTYIDLLQKKKTKYYSNVIIITKELFEKISININSFQKSKIFIFYLEDNSFKYIVDKYDYQNTKNEIIYARLLSTNNIEYNIKHLYIILLICLIILIICIYLFRSKLDTDQRNLTFFFVRTVYFFPIIKFSVTFFYVVKLKFLLDYYDLYNIGTTSIITFLNSSLDILYKSLFITFSIIASKGIDETLKISTQLQMLLFMRKFLLVYFILSSSLINTKYMILYPKITITCLICLETFILCLIYRNKKATQKDIIKQLNISTLYCPEYLQSITIKFKMFRWHFRAYFFYYIIILLLNIYDLNYHILEVEKAIYLHFIDIIIIFAYIIIYRPRNWPDNFDVIFKSNFKYFNHIYEFKLLSDIIHTHTNITEEGKKNNLISDDEDDGYNSDESDDKVKLNTSKTKKRVKKNNFNDKHFKKYYTKNKKYPIIILNPQFFYKTKNERKTNTFNNDIISKSILNSSIGFYNSNNKY